MYRRILKGIILFFICIVFCFSGSNVYAQSLFGTWHDSQYNITLNLKPDGTYVFQMPNGTGQGSFGVNGNTFWMQDASGMNPVLYTIQRFNQNEFVISDVNGVVINYRRRQPPAAISPAPAAKIPDKSTAPVRTLAEKDGHALTNRHIDTGVNLIQFIIGKAIKSTERKELEAQSVIEFNQNPSYFIGEVDSLEQSLTTIRSFSDPLRIGLTRQELFSAFYQATHTMNESNKPLLIQMLNRYIKVLAFDPANNFVLTDRDASGMLNYIAFNSELMGQKIQLTESIKQSFNSDLIRNFGSMPVETKQILCSASLIWQLLDANWNKLTNVQKQQYKQSYMAQLTQASQNAIPYDYQYNTAAPQSSSAPATMAEWQAKQNMYQMMNNMSLNSHALSMNIIENIGGTGDYWSVVDYK